MPTVIERAAAIQFRLLEDRIKKMEASHASLQSLAKRMRASVEDIRKSDLSAEFFHLGNLIEKWATEFDELLNADIYTD